MGYLMMTVCSLAVVRYVDVNNSAPAPPYESWATAATIIQDAVDLADPGDTVLVTNGLYYTGGRVAVGTLTNRVVIDKPVLVQSAAGPSVTIIRGYQQPIALNGSNAVRCVYLTGGAILVGFTLSHGATLAGVSDVQDGGDTSGGGVLCACSCVAVSNCIIAFNSAGNFGGGADNGNFNNCLFYGNSVTPGVSSYGGATLGCVLNNCTLVGNSADNGAGDAFSVLNNCIVYYNNGAGGSYYSSTLNYSCTTPDPGGSCNITNAPLFLDQVNGNYRLQPGSPCINAGRNARAPSGPDLDGNPRIVGGTVDIGAYEFQSPTSRISYAWLQYYGFPLDGSADYADPDGDGMNNWQEWVAGTDPTNALSVLKMLSAVPSSDLSSATISWQSVSNRTYFLERSSACTPLSFTTLASGLVGQDGSTSFTDTNNMPANGPFFYRVGVQ
jgi:hypothetical protein